MVLYTIAGWDHRWPGGVVTAGLPPADPLAGFDATAIIWDFFALHAVRGGAGGGATLTP